MPDVQYHRWHGTDRSTKVLGLVWNVHAYCNMSKALTHATYTLPHLDALHSICSCCTEYFHSKETSQTQNYQTSLKKEFPKTRQLWTWTVQWRRSCQSCWFCRWLWCVLWGKSPDEHKPTHIVAHSSGTRPQTSRELSPSCHYRIREWCPNPHQIITNNACTS